MEKNNFSNLLTDLYTIYNPNGKENIPELVDLYNRQEFDAVKKIFIKYNHRRQDFYDSNIGTDDHVHSLIKEYSGGERSMQEYKKITAEDRRKAELEKRDEQSNKKLTGFKSELSEEVEEQVKKVQKFLADTEKDVARKVTAIKDLMNPEPIFNVKIILQETDEELDLQDKEKLIGLGIGARLVMKNQKDKIYGLEIVDILCDLISEKMPSIELTVTKL